MPRLPEKPANRGGNKAQNKNQPQARATAQTTTSTTPPNPTTITTLTTPQLVAHVTQVAPSSAVAATVKPPPDLQAHPQPAGINNLTPPPQNRPRNYPNMPSPQPAVDLDSGPFTRRVITTAIQISGFNSHLNFFAYHVNRDAARGLFFGETPTATLDNEAEIPVSFQCHLAALFTFPADSPIYTGSPNHTPPPPPPTKDSVGTLVRLLDGTDYIDVCCWDPQVDLKEFVGHSILLDVNPFDIYEYFLQYRQLDVTRGEYRPPFWVRTEDTGRVFATDVPTGELLANGPDLRQLFDMSFDDANTHAQTNLVWEQYNPLQITTEQMRYELRVAEDKLYRGEITHPLANQKYRVFLGQYDITNRLVEVRGIVKELLTPTHRCHDNCHQVYCPTLDYMYREKWEDVLDIHTHDVLQPRISPKDDYPRLFPEDLTNHPPTALPKLTCTNYTDMNNVLPAYPQLAYPPLAAQYGPVLTAKVHDPPTVGQGVSTMYRIVAVPPTFDAPPSFKFIPVYTTIYPDPNPAFLTRPRTIAQRQFAVRHSPDYFDHFRRYNNTWVVRPHDQQIDDIYTTPITIHTMANADYHKGGFYGEEGDDENNNAITLTDDDADMTDPNLHHPMYYTSWFGPLSLLEQFTGKKQPQKPFVSELPIYERLHELEEVPLVPNPQVERTMIPTTIHAIQTHSYMLHEGRAFAIGNMAFPTHVNQLQICIRSAMTDYAAHVCASPDGYGERWKKYFGYNKAIPVGQALQSRCTQQELAIVRPEFTARTSPMCFIRGTVMKVGEVTEEELPLNHPLAAGLQVALVDDGTGCMHIYYHPLLERVPKLEKHETYTFYLGWGAMFNQFGMMALCERAVYANALTPADPQLKQEVLHKMLTLNVYARPTPIERTTVSTQLDVVQHTSDPFRVMWPMWQGLVDFYRKHYFECAIHYLMEGCFPTEEFPQPHLHSPYRFGEWLKMDNLLEYLPQKEYMVGYYDNNPLASAVRRVAPVVPAIENAEKTDTILTQNLEDVDTKAQRKKKNKSGEKRVENPNHDPNTAHIMEYQHPRVDFTKYNPLPQRDPIPMTLNVLNFHMRLIKHPINPALHDYEEYNSLAEASVINFESTRLRFSDLKAKTQPYRETGAIHQVNAREQFTHHTHRHEHRLGTKDVTHHKFQFFCQVLDATWYNDAPLFASLLLADAGAYMTIYDVPLVVFGVMGEFYPYDWYSAIASLVHRPDGTFVLCLERLDRVYNAVAPGNTPDANPEVVQEYVLGHTVKCIEYYSANCLTAEEEKRYAEWKAAGKTTFVMLTPDAVDTPFHMIPMTGCQTRQMSTHLKTRSRRDALPMKKPALQAPPQFDGALIWAPEKHLLDMNRPTAWGGVDLANRLIATVEWCERFKPTPMSLMFSNTPRTQIIPHPPVVYSHMVHTGMCFDIVDVSGRATINTLTFRFWGNPNRPAVLAFHVWAVGMNPPSAMEQWGLYHNWCGTLTDFRNPNLIIPLLGCPFEQTRTLAATNNKNPDSAVVKQNVVSHHHVNCATLARDFISNPRTPPEPLPQGKVRAKPPREKSPKELALEAVQDKVKKAEIKLKKQRNTLTQKQAAIDKQQALVDKKTKIQEDLVEAQTAAAPQQAQQIEALTKRRDVVQDKIDTITTQLAAVEKQVLEAPKLNNLKIKDMNKEIEKNVGVMKEQKKTFTQTKHTLQTSKFPQRNRENTKKIEQLLQEMGVFEKEQEEFSSALQSLQQQQQMYAQRFEQIVEEERRAEQELKERQEARQMAKAQARAARELAKQQRQEQKEKNRLARELAKQQKKEQKENARVARALAKQQKQQQKEQHKKDALLFAEQLKPLQDKAQQFKEQRRQRMKRNKKHSVITIYYLIKQLPIVVNEVQQYLHLTHNPHLHGLRQTSKFWTMHTLQYVTDLLKDLAALEPQLPQDKTNNNNNNSQQEQQTNYYRVIQAEIECYTSAYQAGILPHIAAYAHFVKSSNTAMTTVHGYTQHHNFLLNAFAFKAASLYGHRMNQLQLIQYPILGPALFQDPYYLEIAALYSACVHFHADVQQFVPQPQQPMIGQPQ